MCGPTVLLTSPRPRPWTYWSQHTMRLETREVAAAEESDSVDEGKLATWHVTPITFPPWTGFLRFPPPLHIWLAVLDLLCLIEVRIMLVSALPNTPLNSPRQYLRPCFSPYIQGCLPNLDASRRNVGYFPFLLCTASKGAVHLQTTTTPLSFKQCPVARLAHHTHHDRLE